MHVHQCLKSRFYIVHLMGAKVLKMVHPAISSCVTRYSLYKPISKLGKICTHRVHMFQNLCTWQPKCVHWVQGAPLILNTVHNCKLSLLRFERTRLELSLYSIVSYRPQRTHLYRFIQLAIFSHHENFISINQYLDS